MCPVGGLEFRFSVQYRFDLQVISSVPFQFIIHVYAFTYVKLLTNKPTCDIKIKSYYIGFLYTIFDYLLYNVV